MTYFIIDEVDTVVGPMTHKMATTLCDNANDRGLEYDKLSALDLPGFTATPPVGSDCHHYMSVGDWLAVALEWMED